MTRVYWWPSTARGSWDQTICEELIGGLDVADPGDDTRGEGAVIVLAGQHQVGQAPQIAEFVANLPWCLVIVTSDEEALYPVETLPHDEKHLIFGQYHARPEFDRVLPIGCPPGTAATLANLTQRERDVDVMWAGQDTHERRHELLATLKDMACEPGNGNIAWLATTGFRQGLDQAEFLESLTRTRIAPCPSGPHSLDSFRLYEALAAGALPVIETDTPHGYEAPFWDRMFNSDSLPIPWVESWHDLPTIVERYSDPEAWRTKRDEVQAWWADYRERLMRDFDQTIQTLKAASE